ncbi:NAD-dependent epimerase/dehydratase family protein [Neobacillus sp. K501]
MKVLITGGYGFIGSFVAEKFYREGHEVHILDNLSTGKKSNIYFRHQAYIYNIEDEQCEQIFKTNKFDVVIHLAAQVSVQKSIECPSQDSKVNVMGLINILQLAKKYYVSKFVFASSAAVFGDNEVIPLTEESICNPISPYGMNKLLGEYYCQKWNEVYQLDTLCFRFSNVYGPKQGNNGEGGVISTFIEKIINNEEITIFGDGTQTRDFIFVEDVAEAIYRSVKKNVSGLMNLSTNTETSVSQLVEHLKKIDPIKDVVYREARNNDIHYSRLDNEKIMQEVNWSPKYSVEEGLKRTYQWFSTNNANASIDEVSKNKNTGITFFIEQSMKSYLPYIENIFLFLITAILHIQFGDLFYHFDLLLIYILLVGIIFGKVQAVIACGLSIILYGWQGLMNGREILSLFMDHRTLIQFGIYLFVGLLTGYVIDRKKLREDTAVRELQLFQEKYQLLDEVYMETRKVKDALQTQILYSEASVGEVYTIIRKIDSLEPDEVFNGVIHVLEEIMKTKEAAIYLAGQGNRFLRLVSKSNADLSNFPTSIEVLKNSPFANAVLENKTYINRRLDPQFPMMIAPIWKDGAAVAVICIQDMNFDYLNLYHENLFHVVTNLITDSIIRAFEYVHATQRERYIEGTTILKPEYFKKILESKQKAQEHHNIPYFITRVIPVKNMERVLERISATLRDTDYIGTDEDGTYWILLSNTDKETAKPAINRFVSIIQQHYHEEEIYA